MPLTTTGTAVVGILAGAGVVALMVLLIWGITALVGRSSRTDRRLRDLHNRVTRIERNEQRGPVALRPVPDITSTIATEPLWPVEEQ